MAGLRSRFPGQGSWTGQGKTIPGLANVSIRVRRLLGWPGSIGVKNGFHRQDQTSNGCAFDLPGISLNLQIVFAFMQKVLLRVFLIWIHNPILPDSIINVIQSGNNHSAERDFLKVIFLKEKPMGAPGKSVSSPSSKSHRPTSTITSLKTRATDSSSSPAASLRILNRLACGRQIASAESPHNTNAGRPTAAARCVIPESCPTNAVHSLRPRASSVKGRLFATWIRELGNP